jgi:solute carrier family 5 (high affinity choline transporter), member 7
MRIGIFFVGAGAAGIGILVSSIYVLWYLCSDLVYVILFPQLLCVVYVPHTNTYGSLSAYIVGFVFRFLIGEPSLNLPALIHFGPYIPPKSLCMLISLATTLVVSLVAKILFEKRFLSPRFDVLHCLVDIPNEVLPLKESATTDELHNQYRVVQTTAPVNSEQAFLAEPTTTMINSSYLPSQDTLNNYANSSQH